MAELKKGAVRVTHGVVHIQSTFNNTIVSVTDKQGNVLSWAAAGTCGFKGSRKSTPYAAQVATETAIKKAINEIDKTVNGHEIILKQITFWGKTIVGILTNIMVTLMVQIILQFAR